MKSNVFFITASAAFMLVLSGCASTTIIRAPAGTKIEIDGRDVGVAPYTYSDTKIVGSSTMVTLKKDGYVTKNVTIGRNSNVNVGALIGGILVGVPFLWVMDYAPQYEFSLEPEKLAKN